MISNFDSADQAIEKTINSMCQELERTQAHAPEFLALVEAISKLRASLNPVIQQTQE